MGDTRTTRRWRILGLVALLACGVVLAADDTGGSRPSRELMERVAEHDRDRTRRVVGMTRVRLTDPQELSVGLSALIAPLPRDYDCSVTCEFRGLMLQAEPGLAGAQISAGYAVVTADMKRREHFLADIHLAYGVKGVLLRTWDGADLGPPSQTLLGIEGEFGVIGVNFSLGVFRPVSSGHKRNHWVISSGIGWGF